VYGLPSQSAFTVLIVCYEKKNWKGENKEVVSPFSPSNLQKQKVIKVEVKEAL